jgi:hypothetical protein
MICASAFGLFSLVTLMQWKGRSWFTTTFWYSMWFEITATMSIGSAPMRQR